MTDRTLKPLTLAAIGCGARTRTYIGLAGRQPGRYLPVAAADPRPERLKQTAQLSNNPAFRTFKDADAILAEGKLADVMIIGTQDAWHRKHAIAAMETGYDLLLEKPIATTLEDTLTVEATARRLGRRVLVCHVLRYTPLYRQIKTILESGALGEIVSINATEGVGAFHQAHSFVRGHWAVTRQSSPMILAKSCHDLDILRWLAGQPCEQVSSAGGLTHFRAANAPEGAPERCLDGCPVEDSCPYYARHYVGKEKFWLEHICDLPKKASDEERLAWIHSSPWGRCVYRCDNDAVDHQVVQLQFAGGLTASFTMTAFESGRHIEIYGTKGKLRAGPYIREGYGEGDIVVRYLDGREDDVYDSQPEEGGYASHGGGDAGIMHALYDEMQKGDPAEMTSSLEVSVESHRIAFAAEEARKRRQVVLL